MTANEIELVLVSHFNSRINLIVPNVYWGLGLSYEADLLVLTQSNWAYEIEIKTSVSDMKADKFKSAKAHNSNKFKFLYFAVPEDLKEKALSLIPEKAGLFIIRDSRNPKRKKVAELVKPPKVNKLAIKLTLEERLKLLHLCAMRMWNLKLSNFNKRKIK